MNWADWHARYEISPDLQARLEIVRTQIAAALAERPPGPVRIVSLCSGDGRDLIGALIDHPRREQIAAVLIDTQEESIRRGGEAAVASGLDRQFEFRHADAADARNYVGVAPFDVVLLSGMLGHLRPDSVEHLIESLPMLCASGGSVIWNRHLILNDGRNQVPAIRRHFQAHGFVDVFFNTTGPDGFAAGRVRFAGPSRPLDSSRKLFEFTGLDRVALESWADSNDVPEASPEAEQSIPALFAQIARRDPTRPALISDSWQSNYAELNAASNRLAHVLASRGATGDRIAVLMNHDAPQIASILAILKAGKVFVVLNPTDPPSRLEQVWRDADPEAIVTDETNNALARQITGNSEAVLRFENHSTGPAHDPAVAVAPGAAACLIYTSGSTGRPKGVIQTHRNIIHNALRLSQGMQLAPADRVALLGSLSGGQGLSTTWCALLHGAALCPFPVMDRGVIGLADWLADRRITIYISSASLFRHFVSTLDNGHGFPDVRLVRLASEAATADDFAAFQSRFGDHCVLFSTLSASETGNITQSRMTRADRIPGGRLTVGHAADGMRLLLLDEFGHDVPPGQVGEIAVKSRYLSPGYWRNDPLTAEKFFGNNDRRLFRTGDLGRLSENGGLMVVGRKDGQVKIRGYRIELSEVEAALAGHPAVQRAAVCAETTGGEDARLIAYVVPRPGRECTAEMLRERLHATLPGYMTPAGFVFLPQLPLTPHGKLDREKLRQLQPQPPIDKAPPSDPPATDTEKRVASIWKEIFRNADLGRRDDFFALGGDSLKAAVAAARIQAVLGVELDLRSFAGHSTLAGLAERIDMLRVTNGAAKTDPLVRIPRDQPIPLSFAQERIWKYSQTPEGAAGYLVACSHRIRGSLNIDALRAGIDFLAQRHEILRTAFVETAAGPRQMIHPTATTPLTECDVSDAADPEAETERIYQAEARKPFDLRHPPLLRFTLVKLRENEYRLLRANHHIISDGWSWKIYFRELALIYDAVRRGEKPGLPESGPVQYADYSVWHRNLLSPSGPVYRESLEWWRAFFASNPEPPRLPFTRRRRWFQRIRPSDGLVWWGLQPEVSRRLERFAREERVSFYAVRLTAFAAVLAAETGQAAPVFGTHVTNRNRVETQDMFGFFANLVTLRLQNDWSRPFRESVSTTQTVVAETQARSELPYEQLCAELRRTGVEPPPIRMIFSISDHTAPTPLGDAELSWLYRRMEGMPWGFSLCFDQHNEDHRCYFSFDPRLYDPTGARQFVNRLAKFLDLASQQPGRPVRELLALSRATSST